MYLPLFTSAILRSPALTGEDGAKSIRIKVTGSRDLHVRCDDNSKFTNIQTAGDICVQLLDNCTHVYLTGYGNRLLSVEHDNHCKDKVESMYNDPFKIL